MFSNIPIPPSSYTVHFLRHGQSTGNAAGLYQGQSDFPLSETGIQQAQALAERWKVQKLAFNQIIASPLQRARRTAEIIADALNAGPIEFDDNLMERDNGKIAGMNVDEAERRYPRPAFFTPYTPIGETGESNWALYLRAGLVVDSLLRRPPGRYLVVSHGAILNMVMYVVLGIIPQANFSGARFRFGNTGFATLTYLPERHLWYLENVNDQLHLK